MAHASIQALVFTLLFLAGKTSAFACSCQGESTEEGKMSHADIVFTGEVLSRTITYNYDSLGIKATGDTSSRPQQYPIAVFRIKVDRLHKGKHVSDTLIILTPTTSAACGVRFKTGHQYKVYATIYDEIPITAKMKRRTFDHKTFWTHQCAGTAEIIKENK